ncbi:MAG: hypothetical protein QM705_15245 [Ancrocorticia sp.]
MTHEAPQPPERKIGQEDLEILRGIIGRVGVEEVQRALHLIALAMQTASSTPSASRYTAEHQTFSSCPKADAYSIENLAVEKQDGIKKMTVETPIYAKEILAEIEAKGNHQKFDDIESNNINQAAIVLGIERALNVSRKEAAQLYAQLLPIVSE